MDSAVTRKLKTKDGKVFEAEEKCLKNSNFFKGLMNDFPDNDVELEVNQVSSPILSKVIEYLKHYETEKPKEIPRPLTNGDLKQILSKWDYDFIVPMSIEEVIELINAANYLDIIDLVYLAAARLASEMINCGVEEARAKLGIIPDMNEEEIKEIDKFPLD